MLGLRERDKKRPPIIQSIATTGQGISELADALEAHALSPRDTQPARRIRLRCSINDAALLLLHRHLQAEAIQELDPLCDRVQAGEISLDAAAAELLQELGLSGVRERLLVPTPDEFDTPMASARQRRREAL